MTAIAQREQLATFLRRKRTATDPVSVGLQPGARRRTPGLRREEAAQLAGVSVTWYTWLEQARDIGVSRQVFDRLAQALRMSPAERGILFALAGLQAPAETGFPREVDGLLLRLLDTLDPNPAYILNPWWDILAYNRGFDALLGGLDHRPPAERNLLWLVAADPAVRDIFVDWADEAQRILGQLRTHLALFPNDSRGPELLASLHTAHPRFTEIWGHSEVRSFESARKRLRTAEGHSLELDYLKLAALPDNRQQLVVFLPADEATRARLQENVRSRVLT